MVEINELFTINNKLPIVNIQLIVEYLVENQGSAVW